MDSVRAHAAESVRVDRVQVCRVDSVKAHAAESDVPWVRREEGEFITILVMISRCVSLFSFHTLYVEGPTE